MRFKLFRYVVTPEDLLQMKNHKYDCRGKGIIEQCVDSFAAKIVVPRLPKWLAPNVITIIGFFLHFIGALIVISNDKASFAYMVSDARSILYMIGLFLYGVLDSADGAQARRIGASSPLGELFDHGLDACTMGMVLLSVGALLRFSYFKSRLFILCLGGNFLFFVTHWRAFTFGHLKFSKIDAIEGQYFVQFLFLMNILLGFDFFWFELPTPAFIDDYLLRRMEVADVIFLMMVVFGAYAMLKQLYEIFFINGSTTFAGAFTFSPLIWLVTTVVLCCLNYLMVSYFIYDFIIQVMTVTIVAPLAKLSWTIIICYMCRCSVPLIDTCVVPSLLMFLWFVCLRFGILMDYITHPFLMFNLFFTLSIVDFVYFVVSNIYIISRDLNYPVFTVRVFYHKASVLPV